MSKHIRAKKAFPSVWFHFQSQKRVYKYSIQHKPNNSVKRILLYMHMKYAKRQQLIGCYGTILSAQSKEFFSFIMFANRLEFVWTWIQRKFFFSKISLYTAPKRLIEKVIPNKNHLPLVFFTKLSTSYATMPSILSVLCATLNTFLEKQTLCAQACPARKKGAGQP